jgi:hypothetical protein
LFLSRTSCFSRSSTYEPLVGEGVASDGTTIRGHKTSTHSKAPQANLLLFLSFLLRLFWKAGHVARHSFFFWL